MRGVLLTILSAIPTFLIGFMLFDVSIYVALYILIFLIFILLIGEYLLPLFIQTCESRFDFAERIADSLPLVSGNGNLPSVRVFCLDEDVPIMTWVGMRTVYVSRGCYNLDSNDFTCALKEAYEQRRNLRSYMLLIATVGNPIFFGCRLFCRIGRLFCRLIGIIVGALLSLRHPIVGGSTGGRIGDGIYRIFSFVFLLVSHISVFIPYWPLFIISDLSLDKTLAADGIGNALERLIEGRRNTGYTGLFVREYSIIMRPPIGWRLHTIERGRKHASSISVIPISNDEDADKNQGTFLTTVQSKTPHAGLIIPHSMRVDETTTNGSANNALMSSTSKSTQPIRIKKVSRNSKNNNEKR